MKKIKEPQLKVIKFEAMDIIATSTITVSSASTNTATIIGNNYSNSWK